MTGKYIDSHCHPTVDFGQKAAGFFSSGLDLVGCAAVGEEGWPHLARIAADSPGVFPFFGVHPWGAGGVDNDLAARLRKQLARSRGGVGEIGLDRLRGPDLIDQAEVFRSQLLVATEMARPVVVHCVRAWGLLLEVLAGVELGAGFLVHGFNGSREVMCRLVDMGAMISFSADILRPDRARLVEILQEIPLDRILLETDSPSPRVADPVQVITLYKAIAPLLGMEDDELVDRIWLNGQSFFQN